jgi:hypothetical protein
MVHSDVCIALVLLATAGVVIMAIGFWVKSVVVDVCRAIVTIPRDLRANWKKPQS